MSKLLILALASASLSSGSLLRRWADKCESFTLPEIPEGINVTLTDVSYYPAGSLVEHTNDPNTNFTASDLKDFCRVQLNITTSESSLTKSEVWLPDDWNGRFWGTGNGASGGGITYGELAYGAVNQGFAGHGCNGGHSSNGSTAYWAEGAPEVLRDWHWRGLHQGTVAAKAITAAYYDKSNFTSIFAACSAGGRQGWMEAERFPTDYDSIIVGSPGYDDVRQSASALWANQKVLPVNGSTWFSNDTWVMVHNEVLKQCDEIDGLKDGVLSNPLRCNFQPQKIACRPGQTNTTACLTYDQLQTLRYIYEPWVEANDTFVYSGFPWGLELGHITGNLLPDGGQYGQDGDFFRNIVYNDSSWTVDQISYESVVLGASTIGIEDSSDNPDISAFVKRGGKLIAYVGWNDKYISALQSIYWHGEVDKYMTTHTNYTTEDYYRLFVVPGMGHCSGGAGANVFGQPYTYQTYPPASSDPKENAISALLEWYENGTAPSQIIATSYHDNNVTLGVSYKRPICQWPKSPVYKGKGDTTKAENFKCVL